MGIKDTKTEQLNLTKKEENIQNKILILSADFEELIEALQKQPVASDDKLFIEKMKFFLSNFKMEYKTWMQQSNRVIPSQK